MTDRPSPFASFALLVRDLCQLRRGPEEIAYSPVLLGVLIGLSVLIDVASGSLFPGVADDVLARSLVSTGLLLALCWIALRIRRLDNRYVQTACALIACSIVFSLLVLPLAWLAGPAPSAPAQLTPLQTLLWWGMLALLVWNLAVNAHIMRRALDAPFALGLALAFAWAVAGWAVGHALFDAG